MRLLDIEADDPGAFAAAFEGCDVIVFAAVVAGVLDEDGPIRQQWDLVSGDAPVTEAVRQSASPE